jgi:hypothetical protein
MLQKVNNAADAARALVWVILICYLPGGQVPGNVLNSDPDIDVLLTPQRPRVLTRDHHPGMLRNEQVKLTAKEKTRR